MRRWSQTCGDDVRRTRADGRGGRIQDVSTTLIHDRPSVRVSVRASSSSFINCQRLARVSTSASLQQTQRAQLPAAHHHHHRCCCCCMARDAGRRVRRLTHFTADTRIIIIISIVMWNTLPEQITTSGHFRPSARVSEPS